MPTNPADRLAAIEANLEAGEYRRQFGPVTMFANDDVAWLLAELRTLQQQRDTERQRAEAKYAAYERLAAELRTLQQQQRALVEKWRVESHQPRIANWTSAARMRQCADELAALTA